MTNNPDRVLQEGGGSSPGLQLSAPHHNRVLPVPALPLALPPQNAAAEAVPASSSQSSGLASLFECPVCFDYVLPPILQCHAGHLVCSNCRPKLTCCPTCRGQLGGNIRNLEGGQHSPVPLQVQQRRVRSHDASHGEVGARGQLRAPSIHVSVSRSQL